MNKKQMFILLCIFSFFFSPLFTFAEKIVLKSGKAIEAKIITKTDQEIKVDIEGVPVTYYLDEIESIDAKKITKPSDARANIAITNSPSDKKIATSPVKDVKGFITKVNNAYYDLKKEGLEEFKCEVTSGLLTQNRGGLVARFGADSPEVKAFDSVKFYLTFDKNGKFNVENTPYSKTGNEQFNAGMEQIVGGMKKMIMGFCMTWKGFVTYGILKESGIDYTVNEAQSGYFVSFRDEGGDVDLSFNKDFSIVQSIVAAGNSNATFSPQFNKTAKGLLLSGYTLEAAPALLRTTAIIEYQEIDGLQLPKHLTTQNTIQGMQQSADLIFSNFQVKKSK